jgi:hypothetical protein
VTIAKIVRTHGNGGAGGGGGSIADGASFSFTGPASSSNTLTRSFFGGLNGYLDSGTDGTDMNPPPTGWVGPDNPTSGAGPGSYYPRFDTTQTLSRSKSMGHRGYHKATDPHNWSAFGYGYDCGSGYAEVYHHGYVYYGCLAGLTTLQWKVIKEKDTPSIVDGTPQVNYSHWAGSGNDQFTITESAGDFGTGVYFEGSGSFPNGMPIFNSADRQWYRWEYWHRPATSASANDGAVTIKMWRVSDGTQVMNASFTSIDDYDSATRYRYFMMQNYFGNANPATQQEPGDGEAYWDDVLLQVGAGSRACIWLGDASTYSACNKGKMVYQPWTSWSGTSRIITINKGLHANLTAKYLYETATDGSIINSSGIGLA